MLVVAGSDTEHDALRCVVLRWVLYYQINQHVAASHQGPEGHIGPCRINYRVLGYMRLFLSAQMTTPIASKCCLLWKLSLNYWCLGSYNSLHFSTSTIKHMQTTPMIVLYRTVTCISSTKGCTQWRHPHGIYGHLFSTRLQKFCSAWSNSTE